MFEIVVIISPCNKATLSDALGIIVQSPWHHSTKPLFQGFKADLKILRLVCKHVFALIHKIPRIGHSLF